MIDHKSDILDWKVPIKDLVRNGLTLKYQANDRELDAIRQAYELHNISNFRLEIDLRQTGQGLITVTGKLQALVEQSCVVTLEPVEEKIDITYERLLVQDGNRGKRRKKHGIPSVEKADEVVFEPLEDDPPDILSGNVIDLGKIALEEFILELNPYPRHETAPETAEATYPGISPEDDEGGSGERPFAVLKKIRQDNTGE